MATKCYRYWYRLSYWTRRVSRVLSFYCAERAERIGREIRCSALLADSDAGAEREKETP